MDIDRASAIAALADGSGPSDVSGQRRFLRALILSCPLDPEGRAAPPTVVEDGLTQAMGLADALWSTYFHQERLNNERNKLLLKLNPEKADEVSLAVSLLRTDCDICYVEDVEARCQSVFERLDQDFVIPTLGLPTERIQQGVAAILARVVERLNAAMQAGANLHESGHLNDPSVALSVALRRRRSLFVSEADLPPEWSIDEKKRFFSEFSIDSSSSHPYLSPKDRNITLTKPFLSFANGTRIILDPMYGRLAPSRMLNVLIRQSNRYERFLRIRDLELERATEALFRGTLEGDVYAEYYLPVGPDGALAERDLLIHAGDRLFVVECKAKPLRNPLSHDGNVTKINDDIRASIQLGYEQAESVREHFLNSSEGIDICDKTGRTIGRIDRANVDAVHLVVATWESAVPFSIDLGPWLSLKPETEYPWAVAIDDLKRALTKLRSSAQLGEFIRWRSNLNGRLSASDELDIVGCFVAGHTDVPKSMHLNFDTRYSDIFDDDYFASKGIARNSPISKGMNVVRYKSEGDEIKTEPMVNLDKPSTNRKKKRRRKRNR